MYMFGIILMIMTLISAFGGAIRYKENFIEEILDLLDDETGPVEGSNTNDLADNSMPVPKNNDESLINEAPVEEEAREEVMAPPTSMAPVAMEPVAMEPVAMEPVATVEGYAEVEAYEQHQYAMV